MFCEAHVPQIARGTPNFLSLSIGKSLFRFNANPTFARCWS
jgi:hypothetical protein